jgi:hypothetical protein
MEKFQDNSKYVNMIKNRPSLGLVPLPNKALLGGRYAISFVIVGTLASLGSILLYKWSINELSLPLLKTRK